MWLSRLLRSVILVLLLVASTALIGCSRITLHLIEKTDIMSMPEGESYTPEKEGWFVSNEYMKEVMRARVGK